MSSGPPAAGGEGRALFTDLYELTMLQAYWKQGMHEPAVFSLYFRHLPEARNYMLTCGLDAVLRYLGSPEAEATLDSETAVRLAGVLGEAAAEWGVDAATVRAA